MPETGSQPPLRYPLVKPQKSASYIELIKDCNQRTFTFEVIANELIERFSIECRKTKTEPIAYQLDYSANLKQ